MLDTTIPAERPSYGIDMHLFRTARTGVASIMREMEYQAFPYSSARCRQNMAKSSDLRSTLPLLVAPGRLASDVNPILLSKDSPLRTAHADAPLPRCKAIMLVSLSDFFRYSATDPVMKA